MCRASADYEFPPLPATADSTSASPRATKRTVVSAGAGNPSTRADWSGLAKFCGKAIGIYACIALMLWVATAVAK